MSEQPRQSSTGESAAEVGQARSRRRLGAYGERFALIGAWIALIAIFSALSPDAFFTTRNFSTMLGSQAVLVVLTLGLLIPMTAGIYDISIAGVLTCTSMVVAVLNVYQHWPIALAVLAALAVGFVVGTINGGVSVRFEIDPFIVTLATNAILVGITYWISDSMTVSGISKTLTGLVVRYRFLGIPLEFYYGLVICIALWYFFQFTATGRRVLFVGRGLNVSRLSGIRVGRVRWGCLIASGTVSALAGVMYVGTIGAADPTSGASFMLPAFAAAFLGTTAINPGRFNAWGSFLAVYFLVTGITGMSILGVKAFVQQLFYGGALLLAVAVAQSLKKSQERRAKLR